MAGIRLRVPVSMTTSSAMTTSAPRRTRNPSRSRPSKRACARKSLTILRAIHSLVEPTPKLARNVARPLKDLGKIHVYSWDIEAKRGSSPGQMGHLGRRDRRLRWRAPEINAGPAQIFAFGETHPLSHPSEIPGQRNASLSSSDDQDFILVDACHASASLSTRFILMFVREVFVQKVGQATAPNYLLVLRGLQLSHVTPSCINRAIGACSLMRTPRAGCLNKDPHGVPRAHNAVVPGTVPEWAGPEARRENRLEPAGTILGV